MTTPYVILGSEEIAGTPMSHVTYAFGESSQGVVTVMTKIVGTPDVDTVITEMMAAKDRVDDMMKGGEE